MLPDLSSTNENKTRLFPFWKKTTLASCRGPYPLQNCHTGFQALWKFSSSVLSELLHTYQPSRTLRSSSEKLLKVPKTNIKSAENRSFHYQAAKIWNSLPKNVRSSPSLLFQEQSKNIFLKNASLLVCKTSFLHSLTVWVDVEVVLIWLLMSCKCVECKYVHTFLVQSALS